MDLLFRFQFNKIQKLPEYVCVYAHAGGFSTNEGPYSLQASETRGKDVSSYNSNSYLLTVLISSARKMRKSDCCFRSSFFSVQATSRPLNI